MNFAGEFTLELPYGVSPEDDWPYPFLGNGRMALYPRWDASEGIDNSAKCVLASSSEETQPTYLTDVFRTGAFRVARLDARESLYESDHASLDLYEGVFQRRFVVLDKLAGRNAATVCSETYVPRQYPRCTMHTFDLTVHPAQVRERGPQGLRLYHGARPPDHVEPLTCWYKFSTFNNGSGNNSTPLYVFSGSGRSKIDGSYVSFASAYLWEGGSCRFDFLSGEKEEEGARAGAGRAAEDAAGWRWCELRLTYPERGALPRPENELDRVRLHVLTGHSQSTTPPRLDDDEETTMMEHHERDCRFMVVAIATSLCVGDGAAQKMRREHARQWRSMWSSDVVVHESERVGGDDQLDEAIDRAEALQRYVRLGLYSVYSSVRADNTDLMEDRGFAGVFARLYWTVPLLTLLHPDIGLALLESAYDAHVRSSLDARRKTGVGRLFSRERSGEARDDIPTRVDYGTDALLTALIAMNAWDYYRTTLDDAWLARSGLAILGDCADILATTTNSIVSGEDYQNYGHALTQGCTLLALEYANEAARAARFPRGKLHATAWMERYRELADRWFVARDVLNGDGAAAETTTLPTVTSFPRGVVSLYRGFDPAAGVEEDVADVMALFAPFSDRVWKKRAPSSTSSGDDSNINELFPSAPFFEADPGVVSRLRGINQDFYDFVSPTFVKRALPVANVLRGDGDEDDDGVSSLPSLSPPSPVQVQHPYNIAWKAMYAGADMRRNGRLDRSDADAPAQRLVELLTALARDAEEQRRDLVSGWTPFIGDSDDGDALRRSSGAAYAGCVFVESFLTSMCGRRVFGLTGNDGFAYRQFRSDLFKVGRSVLPPGMDRVVLNLRQLGSGRVPEPERLSKARVESRTVKNNRAYDTV